MAGYLVVNNDSTQTFEFSVVNDPTRWGASQQQKPKPQKPASLPVKKKPKGKKK